jgi:hypothetical protein
MFVIHRTGTISRFFGETTLGRVTARRVARDRNSKGE